MRLVANLTSINEIGATAHVKAASLHASASCKDRRVSPPSLLLICDQKGSRGNAGTQKATGDIFGAAGVSCATTRRTCWWAR
jgi:hypothetical protein